ncbi:unnamed protein product [Polarella glacialis]|nr:unnamed protein product [Polarella glacialis]
MEAREQGLSLTRALLPEVLAQICTHLDVPARSCWSMLCQSARAMPADWWLLAQATTTIGTELLLLFRNLRVPPNSSEEMKAKRIARLLWSSSILDFGDFVCSVSRAEGKDTGPGSAFGWRRDPHYGLGLRAFRASKSPALIRQCGEGAMWSAERVDLRLPLEITFEAYIHSAVGGVHIAFFDNCLGWDGVNTASDALSIAILKRQNWRPCRDVCWIRSRLYAEEVHCAHFRFGTWPERSWGRVSIRIFGGNVQVEAFGSHSVMMRNLVSVSAGTGRTVTGLPPTVHLGFLCWDHDSRAWVFINSHFTFKTATVIMNNNKQETVCSNFMQGESARRRSLMATSAFSRLLVVCKCVL